MTEIILITNIPREKGWLYFTKTDEKGNVILCKSQMGKNKKKEVKGE